MNCIGYTLPAIETKYMKATKTRGPRIVAKLNQRNWVNIPYDIEEEKEHKGSTFEASRNAAEELSRLLGLPQKGKKLLPANLGNNKYVFIITWDGKHDEGEL